MSALNQNNHHDQRDKKIFVGGLAWKTTTDDMRGFFQENFGEVLHANVVLEPSPGGRSKGYGFVTFRDAEAAARACEPPHPMIDGRQTNINLAYLRAKNNNNTKNSNQKGLVHQAGPSHQYQNVSFNHVGPSHQFQQPMFQYSPHFPLQVYWDANQGRYCYTYPSVPYYSTYMMQPKWHEMNNRPRVVISKPKSPSPIPKLEEIKEITIQEARTEDAAHQGKDQESDTEPESDVDDGQEGESIGRDDDIVTLAVEYQEGETSGLDNGINQEGESIQEACTDDVAHQDKDQESDTEPGCEVDDQQKGKDQEGESIARDNDIIKLDVEYQEGETSGEANGTGNDECIKQDVECHKGETSGERQYTPNRDGH
ncbi:unnamed protein product [Microthlaspi erraticum]|uniref:RRM domain-containing protein n=1 Tax=Microthlaspi erraticum TaxID=1685480 RepID=A0A6D2HRF6_9BRAS|nr:unnamed protein product [Microthlaspi erraticum]